MVAEVKVRENLTASGGDDLGESRARAENVNERSDVLTVQAGESGDDGLSSHVRKPSMWRGSVRDCSDTDR